MNRLYAFLGVMTLMSTCQNTLSMEQLSNDTARQYLTSVLATAPQLDRETEQAIIAWLQTQPELVKRLIVQDGHYEVIDGYKEEYKKNNEWLVTQNIKNFSPKSNYHLICPTIPGYIIKISGPSSRYMNTLVANDKWPTTVKPEEIAAFKPTNTYQTASCVVTYALILAYVQGNPLQFVYVPRTYVVSLCKDAPDAYLDQQCVAVQEWVPLVGEEQRKQLIQQLDEAQITELMQLVIKCGVWTLSYDNINFLADGRIVLTDIEQPNVCNPLKGFYPLDPVQWRRNMSAGFADLKKLIQEQIADPAKKDALIALVTKTETEVFATK